jgi:hypothetical protein
MTTPDDDAQGIGGVNVNGPAAQVPEPLFCEKAYQRVEISTTYILAFLRTAARFSASATSCASRVRI